jgi:hypothetical protein
MPRVGRDAAVAISSSHRFLVTGMTMAENMELAAAADQVSRKIEQSIGRQIPYDRNSSVVITVRRDEKKAHGRVIKAQGWPDHRLEQKMVITNIEKVNQEDILEGLCWLLLNRYVIILQSRDDRESKLGTVPDWISTGLAQNLFPALRARNGDAVLKLWNQGEGFSLEEVLEWEYLPEGRWSEKSFSAMAVEWLSSPAAKNPFWEPAFQRLADAKPLSPEWVSSTLLGLNSWRDAEKGWDLWIAHQSEIKRAWGNVTDAQINALRELFTIRPDQLGVSTEQDVPQALSMKDLIRYRDEPWCGALIARLKLKVNSLGIAQAVEYQEVVRLYARFLSDLVAYRKRGFWYRVFHRSPSERQLQVELDEADAALGRLEKAVHERASYVDQVENTFSSGAAASVEESFGADLERSFSRSLMQKYVDDVERRLK